MRWRRASRPKIKAALFSREFEAVCDVPAAAERGIVGRCLIHILWHGNERKKIRGGVLRHEASQRRITTSHPESFVLLNSSPNDSEFIAGAFFPSVKITFLLNYACLCEAAAARRGKVFRSSSAAVGVEGLIIPRLFQGRCWHTTLTELHTNTRKTHAHAHMQARQMAKHHGGDWQLLSCTSFLSLS